MKPEKRQKTARSNLFSILFLFSFRLIFYVNKENLIKKGNESLAIGAIWAVSSVAHPCPLCVLTSAAFIVNGIKEKVSR